MFKFLFLSPSQGAATSLAAATAPEVRVTNSPRASGVCVSPELAPEPVLTPPSLPGYFSAGRQAHPLPEPILASGVKQPL
jgi:hypothetical protein